MGRHRRGRWGCGLLGGAAREKANGKCSHCAKRGALKQTLEEMLLVRLGKGRRASGTAAMGLWAGERNRQVRGCKRCSARRAATEKARQAGRRHRPAKAARAC